MSLGSITCGFSNRVNKYPPPPLPAPLLGPFSNPAADSKLEFAGICTAEKEDDRRRNFARGRSIAYNYARVNSLVKGMRWRRDRTADIPRGPPRNRRQPVAYADVIVWTAAKTGAARSEEILGRMRGCIRTDRCRLRHTRWFKIYARRCIRIKKIILNVFFWFLKLYVTLWTDFWNTFSFSVVRQFLWFSFNLLPGRHDYRSAHKINRIGDAASASKS